jgi:hypothetical protein
MKAVRFDDYGGVEVLDVHDVAGADHFADRRITTVGLPVLAP